MRRDIHYNNRKNSAWINTLQYDDAFHKDINVTNRLARAETLYAQI